MNRRDFVRRITSWAAAPAAAAFFCHFSGRLAPAADDGPAVASGPLRVHPQNKRYFRDASEKPVYLTGSHTWGNLQDQLSPEPLRRFDFPAYLEWMRTHGHNFMRGWAWEHAAWDNHTKEKLLVDPLPYARTGPGTALDGGPKFDLEKFNEDYFRRLWSRVDLARRKGVYVSVMLFEGFSVDNRSPHGGNPWKGHPFNRENNINGIDGDPDSKGSGRIIHTLGVPRITALQERYVRKVIDTVNDLDNVLFEIGNEHYADSAEWQYHLARLIREVEAAKPKQHPIGITSGGGGPDAVTNRALFDSPADWISPRHEEGQPYRDDPPAADGSKVILADTDHLWGLGATLGWVWKSFTRGLNPILMDPYEPLHGLDNFPGWGPLNRRDNAMWEPIRRNLGYSLALARRINLAAMTPRSDLASTGYCLAEPGVEYVVYAGDEEPFTVDLAAASAPFRAQWLDLDDGKLIPGGSIDGGVPRQFKCPSGGQGVLRLVRHDRPSG